MIASCNLFHKDCTDVALTTQIFRLRTKITTSLEPTQTCKENQCLLPLFLTTVL